MQRLLRDDGQIPGCGILHIVIKAIDIAEERIPATQAAGLFIHQIHKCSLAACDVLSQHGCGIVGRANHAAIQQILQRHFFIPAKPGGNRADGNGIQGFPAHRHHIFQITAFQGNQRCHDLNHTGWIEPVIRVISINHGLCVQFVQYHGIRRGQQLFTATQGQTSLQGTAAQLHGGRIFRLYRYQKQPQRQKNRQSQGE